MLQSLGTMRSRKASPGKTPPSKRSKHKEHKLHPMIAAALQDGGNSTKGQPETNTMDQQGRMMVQYHYVVAGHMGFFGKQE